MTKVFEQIEVQQKGHEKEPLFMVGEQLKEIAAKEPLAAELLEKDLATQGMGLADAAKKLQEYADKNHGRAKCFCITPPVAEKILREFYGLPEPVKVTKKIEQVTAPKIDLSDFL